jgi:hypothetical protein
MNTSIIIIIIVAMIGNIAIAYTLGKPTIEGVIWSFTAVSTAFFLWFISIVLLA